MSKSIVFIFIVNLCAICYGQINIEYQPNRPSFSGMSGGGQIGQLIPPGKPWPANAEDYTTTSSSTVRPTIVDRIKDETSPVSSSTSPSVTTEKIPIQPPYGYIITTLLLPIKLEMSENQINYKEITIPEIAIKIKDDVGNAAVKTQYEQLISLMNFNNRERV